MLKPKYTLSIYVTESEMTEIEKLAKKKISRGDIFRLGLATMLKIEKPA